MELTILFDHRFYRTPARTIYSPTSYSYQFFQKRYLGVFDNVIILARVADVPGEPPNGRLPSEGPSVRIIDLGDWTGAWGFLRSRQKVVDVTRHFMDRRAAFLLIVPGGLPSLAFSSLDRGNYPFALEVVGDPWEAYGSGAIRHPLRPILRRWFSRSLRHQCELAEGSLYVTEYALQQMYPCGGVTAGVSDVVLDPESFTSEPRTYESKLLRIITVGSMANLHKGYDVLIDAVAMCVRRGLDVQLVLVGDGRHKSELLCRAEVAGLAARTRFTGEVHPASAVRAALDAADLFVLPSRTEGLPRALVEAMARALPCIGTAVGGIPELLHKDDLVAPRDARALGGRILEVASDSGRMAQMSRRNWLKAFEYQQAPLIAARADFYQRVKERTNKRLFSEPELDRLGSSETFREESRS